MYTDLFKQRYISISLGGQFPLPYFVTPLINHISRAGLSVCFVVLLNKLQDQCLHSVTKSRWQLLQAGAPSGVLLNVILRSLYPFLVVQSQELQFS